MSNVEKCALDLVVSSSTRTNTVKGIAMACTKAHFSYQSLYCKSRRLRGPLAFYRAAMPSQAVYRSVQNARGTQGSSRLSCMSHAYNPHAVGSKLGREPPPTAIARRCKKVDAPLPQDASYRCPRPQQAARRWSEVCRSDADEAAGRLARAATICQPTCRTQESKAEVSLSRSAAVTRKVLPRRGAQQRSRQGEWRPSDIVRATPGRACRFDAPICADLLGA